MEQRIVAVEMKQNLPTHPQNPPNSVMDVDSRPQSGNEPQMAQRRREKPQDESQSDFEDPDWEALRDNYVTARSQNGALLVSRLATAPTHAQMEKMKEALPHYRGVPRAPAATRNREDVRLHKIQMQLEDLMNLCVRVHEVPDEAPMTTSYIVALTRRLFEDVNESRRQLFSKGATHVLKREDDEPHLLQPDEEKALRECRKTRQFGKPRNRRSFSSFASFSSTPAWTSSNNNKQPFRGRSPFRGQRSRGRGGRNGGGGRRQRSQSQSQ